MKIFSTSILVILGILLFTNISCKDELVRTQSFTVRVPVFMTAKQIRSQVIRPQAPKSLGSAGRIYLYKNFLLINEPNKGLHIVDNSNPARPIFLNYIQIPGNSDLAINQNMLYADSYMDLLVFNLNNPFDIPEPKRINDVFKSSYPENKRGEIVSFKDSLITMSSNSTWGGPRDYLFDSSVSGPGNSTGQNNYGTGGSTARFTLMNDHLYTVDHTSLKLFNVSTPADPKFENTIFLGTGIETIFPYDNKLFIGSTTGMHIYNAVKPSAPVKLSTYSHLTSCDPVIVEGNFAYVTLRSGTTCRLGSNVLEVLDIGNPTAPKLISSFPMTNPHGLALQGDLLFICEGNNGLRTFDRRDPLNIGSKQLSFLKDLDSRDVIAGPLSVIVTGKSGIMQYEFSDPRAPKLLSNIKVVKDIL